MLETLRNGRNITLTSPMRPEMPGADILMFKGKGIMHQPYEETESY